MAERFEVRTLVGYLRPQTGNAGTPPGVTASVHDRAYRRCVATFRSEEYVRGSACSRELVLAAAEAECIRLNAKYPEGFPA